MSGIRLKRAYEQATEADGLRVLVERLWPRGVSKQRARIDHWAKEVAPATGLRRWYGHDPARWEEFQRRYRAELDTSAEAVGRLEELLRDRAATFVYGSREPEKNSAQLLRAYLAERAKRG